ncbi:ISAzo13-like element transposase-related protein [Aeromicrobium sp.]|uniref:ISAzo13-like element transposase-related protein n=1 Tax=Aeromicrobium sp. TaxID=1871063 RepID=UPI0039E54CDC
MRVHDFKDPELGKVSPSGIYDIATGTGWVSVGTGHDTAAFAVNARRRRIRRLPHPSAEDRTHRPRDRDRPHRPRRTRHRRDPRPPRLARRMEPHPRPDTPH